LRRLRQRRRPRRGPASFEGINITPFTDVLLVLLIIFMMAGSSLAPTGLGLSGLASGQPAAESPGPREALLVEVARDGSARLTYGAERLSWSQLRSLPRATRVTLSGQAEATAEQVIRQYDRLLSAGLRDIQWAPPSTTRGAAGNPIDTVKAER
jgi:biopolymer transport protein ExbD